jgi:DNA repair exonuclease SbcCD ATPase subunit
LQAEYLAACSFEKKLGDLKRDMESAEEALYSVLSETELFIKELGLTEIPSLESLDKAYHARKTWEAAKARQPDIDHQLLSALEQWHKLPAGVKQDRLDKRSRTSALLSLESAVDTEAKRMEDLASDIEAARATKEYSVLCAAQSEMVASVREHFRYDGIPAMVCKHYAAALSDAVNRYLPMFDAAYTISIGDKLDTVCHFGKHAVQVEDLSGGQEVVLGICVRLAIMEIAADSVPFIVMDEPTPHLDKSRRAAMVSVFEKVAASAKTFGRQFIVSTHEDELASVADHTIEL